MCSDILVKKFDLSIYLDLFVQVHVCLKQSNNNKMNY